MSTSRVVSSPSDILLIDEPRVITDIDTDREYTCTISHGMACLNDAGVVTT